MEINKRLAHLKHCHEELLRLLPSLNATEISSMSEGTRNRVVELVRNLSWELGQLDFQQNKELFEEGDISVAGHENLVSYFKNSIMRDRQAVEAILTHLNPEFAHFIEFISNPPGARRSELNLVHHTFSVGIERICALVEENPEHEEFFLTDGARAIMNSKLIDFDPDQWIENRKTLKPIMTSRIDRLPVQVRIRMKEVHRGFIFGNWLSVVALARAVLEYAIVDNASRLEINVYVSITLPEPRKRIKSLSQLIDDLSEQAPALRADMEAIRDSGNQAVHPRRTSASRAWLFQVRESARQSVRALTNVVEALYLPPT